MKTYIYTYSGMGNSTPWASINNQTSKRIQYETSTAFQVNQGA